MVQKYDKLIRDNLIEKMRKKGLKVEYEVLDEETYKEYLKKKLVEEVNEFLEDENIKELADIMEVIYAILSSKDIPRYQLEEVRVEKRRENGGFEERILLRSVED